MFYDKEFKIILEEVKRWVKEIDKEVTFASINFEILINDERCFRMIFENASCIGEVIVEQTEFAPYRFVKIEILSTREDEDNPIFIWYDKENDKHEYIVFQLQKGINYAMEYC